MEIRKVEIKYYEILGISRDASEEEIKAAFRKAAQRLHPDRPGGDTAAFAELQAAYRTLRNPEKRRRYDQYGAQEPIRPEISEEAKARDYILGMILGIVDKLNPQSAKYKNIMKAIENQISQDIGKTQEALSILKKKIDTLQIAESRFETDNIFVDIALNAQIARIEEQIEKGQKELDALRFARKYAREIHYKYETQAQATDGIKRNSLYQEFVINRTGGTNW